MKYNITKEELIELFIIKNMRRKDVANYYGCSDANIKKKLKEYGIVKPFELECDNKKRRTAIECCHCKMIFFVKPTRKNAAKFCSPKCSQDSRYLGYEHKQKVRNIIAARRRARLKKLSPALTPEEENRLNEIYKTCPKGYEVDHIMPLAKGGLHHPDNLQILPMIENRKKGSKWIKM